MHWVQWGLVSDACQCHPSTLNPNPTLNPVPYVSAEAVQSPPFQATFRHLTGGAKRAKEVGVACLSGFLLGPV